MKPISEMTPMEIREAVATRVMGLSPVSKLYDPLRDMFVDVTAKRCANDRDVLAVKGPLDMWRELPAYESEIGPAVEVVDKCRAIGVYIEVIAMASVYLVNWQAYSDATTILDAGTERVKTLDQVPLAVCKSALAALEAIGSAK